MSFRFLVFLPDGQFDVSPMRSTGWTHVVLNYLGPNNGQGIRIYYDGEQTGSGYTKYTYTSPTGAGRVVVGRYYTVHDAYYTSVHVDELLFFNEALDD